MLYLKAVVFFTVTTLVWAGGIVFGASSGWFSQPISPVDNARLFMNEAVEIIESENTGNTALVLIEDGALFDEHYVGSQAVIDNETIFQTASMSKWITATGVMTLVAQGKLDLDRPIQDYLTRWQLPPSEFDNSKVTTRLLLSHTSGLSDGLGFGDYLPDEAIPAIEESLTSPRASDNREVEIKVGQQPGAEFSYSGGGYLLLQLLIEEVSGVRFEDYMQKALLGPLRMSRSSFDYVAGRENISSSYDSHGNPAILYRYAAKGATGFSTSAKDMVRFAQTQVASGAAELPIVENAIESTREPHARVLGADIWGLGAMLYTHTDRDDYVFGHDGQNDPAINTTVRINPVTRDAIIVLTSGSQTLATALGYEWVLWQTGRPDFLHTGAVIEDAMPIAFFGSLIILLLTIAWTWRRRAAHKNGIANL